jgi:hypothetical protein
MSGNIQELDGVGYLGSVPTKEYQYTPITGAST